MTSRAPVSLPVFLVLWNRAQRRSTPALHLRMARWLEAADDGTGDDARMSARRLLMAFRGAGKSTIAGIFCAWTLYRAPQTRILVLAADDALAARMVRHVRRILERHLLTAHLRPARADQWAADRFTVVRDAELRDPSMRAAGIAANVTGSRADLIVWDDVEVPNTCETPDKRDSLRARLTEADYILTPGGRILALGTPHTVESIYADDTTRGFARLEIPVLDDAGASAWPERFSSAHIESIRTRTGPNKFASQMLLRPVDIAQGRLDPALLGVYDEEPVWNREIGGLWLGGERLVGASAWWDPAFGAAHGDASVLACVFMDARGHYRVQRMAYLAPAADAPPQGAIQDAAPDDDEASAQCRAVAHIARSLFLPVVAVETNGLGKFLPAILRRELARARSGCVVREIASRRPKDLRILEAFDAPMAARRILIHRSVLSTPLMREMRGWRPGLARGHDDGIDALAGALALHPVRIERLPGPPAPRPDWRPGTRTERARTGFPV